MTTKSLAELIAADAVLTPLLKMPAKIGTCRCGKATYATDRDSVCFACARAAEEKRQRAREAADYFGALVPELYRSARFDLPELAQRCADPKAIAKAKTASLKPQRVTLLGPSGAGKSTLATAIAWEWTKLGKRVRFVSARRLAVARQQSPLGEGEADEVHWAVQAPCALIDDVGSEPAIVNSALSDTIDGRFSAARPSIVTCGLTPAQMGERYGDGIARRILEAAFVIDVKPRAQ